MGSGARLGLAIALAALLGAGCSLFTSLDGFEGEPERSTTSADGGEGAAPGDGGADRPARLLALGGSSGVGEPLADAYVADMRADGTISSWRPLPMLPYPLSGAACAAPGALLLVGGYRPKVPQYSPDVIIADLLDGGIGPWVPGATALPSGRARHASTFHRGHLYVVGGTPDATSSFGDVLVAPVAGGRLSTVRATTPLPAARSRACVAAAKGMLYVTGGIDEAVESHPEARTGAVGRIGADGNVTAWSPLVDLPGARAYHACFASETHLYVVGGEQTDAVASAAILPDGTVSFWGTVGRLPDARAGMGAVVANGRLYLVGGSTENGTSERTPRSEVLMAPILDGGGLGSFVHLEPLPSPRWHVMAAAF